jgi:ABC-type phosphate transport system substrate-binding protein
MRNSVLYGFLACATMLFVSCKNDKKEDVRDTPEKGVINISVDESFKPVIEEQLSVHHSSFPNATINVSYKSEAACFRDLQSDSTRMIIVAKGLNEKEEEYYLDRLSFKPQYGILAYDAVTVIVNRESKDSVFTIAQLKDILSGKNNVTAVMDLFAKPSQASLAYGEYPLARPLYYILKENTAGLGTGFMNFMSLERGQLIFRRSFLVPAKMGFNRRTGKIKDAD